MRPNTSDSRERTLSFSSSRFYEDWNCSYETLSDVSCRREDDSEAVGVVRFDPEGPVVFRSFGTHGGVSDACVYGESAQESVFLVRSVGCEDGASHVGSKDSWRVAHTDAYGNSD